MDKTQTVLLLLSQSSQIKMHSMLRWTTEADVEQFTLIN